ncbi:helix-turn-helix domain-containing protein [Streptomyces sp. SBT349]|uniref:helix-turn-helix domain-containing protein n=1 Tax=Streptomyces sp. SBT349 TaxID=1580539 RepID=UPI0018FE2111|nr:helix-turn-helix transcriptional regulator [Streptomyces sp. SBT349]
MTPNDTAITALREARKLSIRELARRAGLHHATVSRIERGQPAGADTLRRIAEVFAVSPADITRGDDVSKAKPRAVREVPLPNSPEGELFHYTPEEVAGRFLPWTARSIRDKARAYEIPRCGGPGQRITLTGRQICEINASLEIRPLAETRAA